MRAWVAVVGLLVALAGCGDDGSAGVPLYGGGCETDADCGEGVCRAVAGLRSLCTAECDADTPCSGFAACLQEGLCVEYCGGSSSCNEGAMCRMTMDGAQDLEACFPSP